MGDVADQGINTEKMPEKDYNMTTRMAIKANINVTEINKTSIFMREQRIGALQKEQY
jgi:hypothetical protein